MSLYLESFAREEPLLDDLFGLSSQTEDTMKLPQFSLLVAVISKNYAPGLARYFQSFQIDPWQAIFDRIAEVNDNDASTPDDVDNIVQWAIPELEALMACYKKRLADGEAQRLEMQAHDAFYLGTERSKVINARVRQICFICDHDKDLAPIKHPCGDHTFVCRECEIYKESLLTP